MGKAINMKHRPPKQRNTMTGEGKASSFRKSLMSVNIFGRNSGAGNGCANEPDRPKKTQKKELSQNQSRNSRRGRVRLRDTERPKFHIIKIQTNLCKYLFSNAPCSEFLIKVQDANCQKGCCGVTGRRCADHLCGEAKWPVELQGDELRSFVSSLELYDFLTLDVVNRASRFAAIRVATGSQRFQIARFELQGQSPFESLLTLTAVIVLQ